MERENQRANPPQNWAVGNNRRLRNELAINEVENNSNITNNPTNVDLNNININLNNNNNNVIPYRRDPDQLIPIANINRIMRRILPSHAKISEDSKELLQQCTSEFISFIMGEANERCQQEYRKTVSADDILYAISRLGFDNYVDPLNIFLNRYRQREAIQTVAHGDPSVRRTTDFSGIVQPLHLPLPPHMPNIVTVAPGVYENYYNQNVQDPHGLFDQATIQQYNYFESGASSNPDGLSESSSNSSLAPSLSRRFPPA